MSEIENPGQNVPPQKLEITFINEPCEEPVTMEQVAEWKAKGNYELLEHHIRNGEIELLPKSDLVELLTIQQEHLSLIQTIQKVFESIQPIFEKQEELKAYIDPASKFKVNLGKLIEEVISAQNLNPFSKKDPKPIPILQLLQEAIDLESFQEINLLDLKSILSKNKIELKPLLEFLIRLGVLSADQFQKPVD